MAGPSIPQIFADGVALTDLNEAPREFIFRFDQTQPIELSSVVAGGIQFVGSGGDGVFGNDNDRRLDPIFTPGATPNEIVARFATPPVQDRYRLTIVGQGPTALRNQRQEVFNNQTDRSFDFNVNVAPRVLAIVPQPTASAGASVSQAGNQIQVFFSENIPQNLATDPRVYQLINTRGTLDSRDDVLVSQAGGVNPITGVTYLADPATRTFRATITFTNPLAEGQYRLRIGNNDPIFAVPNSPPVSPVITGDPGETFASAADIRTAASASIGGQPGTQNSFVISNQRIDRADVPAYLLRFPGNNDEPGHRHIAVPGENHVGRDENGNLLLDDLRLDGPGIQVQRYNFRSDYGVSQTGQALINNISETQKQRIREIFSLYGHYLGIQFVETNRDGWAIAVGDVRARGTNELLEPTPANQIIPIPPAIAGQTYRTRDIDGDGNPDGLAVLNGNADWGASEYGGAFFLAAMHEVGELLGLERAGDLPLSAVMNGTNEDPLRAAQVGPVIERMFPSAADIIHGQLLYRPESRDIDFYRIQTTGTGTLKLETLAERRVPQASLLDTVISVYDSNFKLIARNDNYFGKDSLVKLENLAQGTYFIAITSTGNTDFDGRIEDSGMGGTTEGAYDLRVDFDPATKQVVITDDQSLVLDGDNDGRAGGDYNFWFEVGSTIFVNKTSPASGGNGSLANPFNTIAQGLVAAGRRIVVPTAGGAALRTGDNFSVADGGAGFARFYFVDSVATPGFVIPNQPNAFAINFTAADSAATLAQRIRQAIAGALVNGQALNVSASNAGAVVSLTPTVTGTDPIINLAGSAALLQTPNIVRIVGNGGTDGQIGTTSDATPYILAPGSADGDRFVVPQGVTVMIDRGTVIKLQGSDLEVGNSLQNISRLGAAIQVLGTPDAVVSFTSRFDDTRGGNTDPPNLVRNPFPGDWGSIIIGADADYEEQGIFLNNINQAEFMYGGGTPALRGAIDVRGARPTISNSVFQLNSYSAITADPDSFTESDYGRFVNFTVDYDRVGLEVHGNTVVDNSFNGMVINIDTPVADQLERWKSSARFNDSDIVHIIPEDIIVGGNPGGPIDITRTATARLIAPNYVQLDDLASSQNGAYNGLEIVFNVQVGSLIQQVRRNIVAYDGLTKSALVDAPLDPAVIVNRSFTISGRQARPSGRLAIDGGVILKSRNARIETEVGAQFIAEGSAARPVVMTSFADDTYGAGGSRDSNNDRSATSPRPGDWAGLYFGPTSKGSVDYARLTYSGGQADLQGGSAAFNTIEIVQADVRVANSVLRFNASGFLGTSLSAAPQTRAGKGFTSPATILVRGAQPTLINNTLQDNVGPAISINANSLTTQIAGDQGRESGYLAAVTTLDANAGPLVRGNTLTNNGINGMLIRGETLDTESIWDDTDIVHVLLNEIVVPNFHTFGGLRLQSSQDASLVVKLASGVLSGQTAGITAGGSAADIDDRIGGTVHIVGRADRPVILTSYADDTVGAGRDVFGRTLTDTNNDLSSSQPGANPTGDWRGIRFTEFANDRNVAIYLEKERPYIKNTSGVSTDVNGTPLVPESLGILAANEQSSNDTARLGFQVEGTIALDDPTDVDVYSFSGVAGSEVWIDIDQTRYALDAIVELVDQSGAVLARAQTNAGQGLGMVNTQLAPNRGPLPLNKDTTLGGDPRNFGDFYSINPRDPGMRLILPGQEGSRTNYFLRVRSSPQPTSTLTGVDAVKGGISRGHYQLDVRLRQLDEKPGATVRYADIRYAATGVEILGLPKHSPLTGEASDREGDSAGTTTNNNDTLATAQNIGNILKSDRNTISVGGFLAGATDIDWYRFNVDYDFIQSVVGLNNAGKSWSAIFDIDYADGLPRPDTQISIFDAFGRLILVGRDSNVEDDQQRKSDPNAPKSEATIRGSFGKNDPYIGPVQLPTGTLNGASGVTGAQSTRTYYVAVSSAAQVAQSLDQFYLETPTNPLIRLEPVNSINRIAEDHIDYAGYAPMNPATGELLYPSSPTGSPPHVDQASRNPLFGPTNGIGRTPESLGAQGTPLTLGDVVLFAVTGRVLRTFNPFTGALETRVGETTGDNDRGFADITMRVDGRLMGLTSGTNDQTIGNLIEINPGSGAGRNRGDDGLTQEPNGYPALAFRTLTVNNEEALNDLYSVNFANQYIRHERNTGLATGPGLGVIRQIGFRSELQFLPTTTGDQFTDGSAFSLINPAQVGSQPQVFEFNNPATIVVNQVPNVAPNAGADQDVRFRITRGSTTLIVELNTNTANIGNGGTNRTIDITTIAGTNTTANRNILASLIATTLQGFTGQAIPSNVYFTDVNALDIVQQTGSNLALINNQADATLRIQNVNGINTFRTLPNGTLQFLDATEMQTRIIAAVNTAFGGTNLARPLNSPFGVDFPRLPVSSVGGPSLGTAVTLLRTDQLRSDEQITGMAFRQLVDPENVYFVTNQGRFIVADANSGEIIDIIDVPGVSGDTGFNALTNMPRNVEGRAFEDLFMAVTLDGRLFALNELGQPVRFGIDINGDRRQIFYNGESSIQLDSNFLYSGLAFSTADYNLWHASLERALSPGHGLSETFDDSRTRDNIGGNPTSPSNQGLGTLSYRFAYDGPLNVPGTANRRVSDFPDDGIFPYGFRNDVTDTYNVPGGAAGSLISNEFSLSGYSALDRPTLYFNYYLQTENARSHDQSLAGFPDDAMRDSFRTFISDDGINWHQLTTNNSQASNYFDPTAQIPPFGRRTAELPEGPYDTTNGISQTYYPQGGEYLDNPHLTAAQDAQRRVQQTFDQRNPTFINPSLDTTARNFRQVRVDLGDFAGKKNLRLRFDFSTAGDMFEPAKLRVVIPTNDLGVKELNLLDGRTINVVNALGSAQFEVDTNGVATSTPFGVFFKQRLNFLSTALPTDFFDGATIRIAGRTFEFNRTGGVTLGNIEVDITSPAVNGTVLGILQAFGQALDNENLLDVVQQRGISGQTSVIFKSDANITTSLNPSIFNNDAVSLAVVFVGDANFDGSIDETDIAARIRDTVNYYSVTTGLTDFGARTSGLLSQVNNTGAFTRTGLARQTLFRFEDTVQFHSPRQSERPIVSSNYQAGLITFNTSTGPARWDVGANGELLPGDVLGDYEDTIRVSGREYGRGQANGFEGAYIDDLVIGFAERGEMVTRAPNPTVTVNTGTGSTTIPAGVFPDTPAFVTPPIDPNTFATRPTTTGAYQLEIRNGVNYGSLTYQYDLPSPAPTPEGIDPFPAPNLRLDRSFDTNDRQATGYVIEARAAADIVDGTNFTVNDGYRQVRFEFNKDLGFQVARIPNRSLNTPPDLVLSFNNAANPTTPITIELDTDGVNNGTAATRRVNIADLTQNNLTTRQELARRIVSAINSIQSSSARAVGDSVFVVGGFNFTNVFDDQFPSTQPVLTTLTGWSNGRSPNGTSTIPTVVINLTVGDTAAQVADKIAQSIRNATTIGSRLDVSATTLNLEKDETSPNPMTARVSLLGATIIDRDPLFTQLSITQFGRANGDGTFTNLGDENRVRDQGQIIIDSNRISNSPVGILVAAGETSASTTTVSTRNLPVRSVDNQVPGVVLVNNIISNFVSAGIRLAGDANLSDSPQAAFALTRVVNNTIVGGVQPRGIGIDVGRQSDTLTSFVTAATAPTLMNNILSNTLQGVRIQDDPDATAGDSRAGTVLTGNVFQGNAANVSFNDTPVSSLTSVDPIGLNQSPTLPLFIDIASGNFQLRLGTQTVINLAVDSANNSVDDRSGLAAFRQGIGWAPSPIVVPDVDQLGLVRQDDPNSPTPPGLGGNFVKDRGALERTDFFGPLAILITPADNQAGDTNPLFNEVAVAGGLVVKRFEIQLREFVGVGVDDASVLPAAVTIRRNNGNPLVAGRDYDFVYDAERDVISVISRGAQFPEGTYRIDLNNSANGIRDLAGNPVLSNRIEGTNRPTAFLVSIDLVGPTGQITTPLDNGPQDTDNAPNQLTVRTATGLSQLELTLQGGQGGINPTSVNGTKFVLTRDGSQLTQGVDYQFNYDPATGKVILQSLGSLFIPGVYALTVDNTDAGVLDNTGNPLQPNQNDGSTRFQITLLLNGPSANLLTPADNVPGDGDPALNRVEVVSRTGLPRIDVLLVPFAPTAGIDPTSVTSAKARLFRGATQLVAGVDYTFVYTAGTNTISFILAPNQPVPAEYRVQLDNTATGILDVGGGRLSPNRADGTTQFVVSVVPPGPVARLISPLDGGPADKDPEADEVQIYTLVPIANFDVLLRQFGFAINDGTVDATKITLRRNGVAQVQGVDYNFLYTPSTDTIRLSSVAAEFTPGLYEIQLDNSAATGIRDTEGNTLRPNRPNGNTVLSVSFAAPGPIQVPSGIFFSNVGLSDIGGNAFVGFRIEGDALTRVTVSIDSRTDPTGTIRNLVSTSVVLDQNGVFDFSRSLPRSANGETLSVTVRSEFGATITNATLIGPRATSLRAYTSSLFNKLLNRDGRLTQSIDEFTPLESLGNNNAIAGAMLNTDEFIVSAVTALVQDLLGRAPRPSELATYGTQFRTTGSFDQARITMLTSDEFARIPADRSLNFNDAGQRAQVTDYVQRVYAKLIPGYTLSAAELDKRVRDVFEAGRRWILTNTSPTDGGVLASSAYRTARANRAFQDCLGRNATPAEIASLGGLSDRDLLRSVITSADFYLPRLADSIYREFLQRGRGETTPAEINSLVNYLRSGATESQARARVIGSDEFKANAGGTLEGFVENAFRQVLLRVPTPSEITAGVGFVGSNGGDTNAGREAYALLLLANPDVVLNNRGIAQTGPLQSSGNATPVIGAVAQIGGVEGSAVSASVRAIDPNSDPIAYRIVAAPSGATIDPVTGQFTWAPTDDYRGLVPITVEAFEQSASRLRSTRTFLVQVNNAAPTAAVSTAPIVTGGQLVPVTLQANDPGLVDSNSNFRFDVDWNNDGVFDETIIGRSGSTVQRSFAGVGRQSFAVRATDKDGGTSATTVASVFIGGVFVEPNPANPSQRNLTFVGTDGDDNVRFEQIAGTNSVNVYTTRLNGQVVNTVQRFDNITGFVQAVMGAGNDTVLADQLSNVRISIDGGVGNDSLRGGMANDTILGGDGNDTIWGMSGSDNIDGGVGNDRIFGDVQAGQGFINSRSTLGQDTIRGGAGNDEIYGDSDGGEGANDWIDAGDGNDTVYGDGSSGYFAASDTIFGGDGNDILFGDHPSALASSGGPDFIDGGAGSDIVYGGGGADSLYGGTGSDFIIADVLSRFITPATMFEIQKEWNSGNTVGLKRDYITLNKTGGLNGFNIVVPGSTILDDNSVDQVFAGNDQDGDWIVATRTEDSVSQTTADDIIDLMINL
ncbi:hypothetical protein K2X85_00875 [bacterium]|nr:hypothetical protein [bacterium]